MTRIVFVLLIVATAGAVGSLAGEPLRIASFTIDGGGVMRSTSDDGLLALSGTIGQPDAGEIMTGGEFTLTGGFWFESPSGDCNVNGFVDLADHAAFVDCMTTPEDIGPDLGCECHDVDGNQRIDLADFAENQRVFIGD